MNKTAKYVIISVAIVIISGLLTYTGLTMFVDKEASSSVATTPEVQSRTKTTSGLEVTLATKDTQQEYNYGDTLKLRTTVHNAGQTEMTYEFSDTCTGPETYFNDTRISPLPLCGMAFTSVVLAPGQTKEYDDEFSIRAPANNADAEIDWDETDDTNIVIIAPGTYKVTTIWHEYSSNAIAVTIRE